MKFTVCASVHTFGSPLVAASSIVSVIWSSSSLLSPPAASGERECRHARGGHHGNGIGLAHSFSLGFAPPPKRWSTSRAV
jgi:hypothetical protein